MAQLTEKIFTEKINEPVVQEVLRWYLASRRRGTHAALTRSEVSGGGKKPWRQKGTGRARAGSTRSPLWRKGGVIFPPKPRDHGYALPKKMRRLALRVVLSRLNSEERIKVLDSLNVAEPKTKAGIKLLNQLGISGNVLVLLNERNSGFERALRNIAGVTMVTMDGLNIFDLLRAGWLLIDRTALAPLTEKLAP